MARHKVEICGVNTANIKVLSYDEQVELFKKLKSGDLGAKEELINGNLKLVLSILKPFTGRCDNMDDLFQVGTIGLIKCLKIKEKYLNEESREPTTLEIANILNVSEFEVCNALNSLKDTVSMYEPIYNDGGDVIYLADQLSEGEGVYDLETKISLKKALNKIKEKERYILIQRYMIGKTQMELASEIGISQAQISRLEKNGLDSIKRLIK